MGILDHSNPHLDSFWLQQAFLRLFMGPGQFAGLDFCRNQLYGASSLIEPFDYGLSSLFPLRMSPSILSRNAPPRNSVCPGVPFVSGQSLWPFTRGSAVRFNRSTFLWVDPRSDPKRPPN